MSLALLQIDNVPYIDWDAGERPVTWRGSTDNDGRFDAPLSFRGYYDLAVRATVDPDLPEYVFIGLHTEDTEPQIVYEGELAQARMLLPAGMPPVDFETGDLRLRETVIRPVTGEDYRRAVHPILASDGRLQGFLPDGRWDGFLNYTSVEGPLVSLSWTWGDAIEIPAVGEAALLIDLEPVEIRWVIPIEDPAPGEMLVDTGWPYLDDAFGTEYRLPIGVASSIVWTPSSSARLRVSSLVGPSFLPKDVTIGILEPSVAEVHLGSIELLVRVLRDGAAVEGVDCSLEFEDYRELPLAVTDAAGNARFWLDPGRSVLSIPASSPEHVEILDLVATTTLTIELGSTSASDGTP